MTPPRKIAIITGSRAEYGLLRRLILAVRDDADLELQLLVTGMHWSPEFGNTHQEIEQDGLGIDEAVEVLLSSDTPVGTAKAMGLGVIGFADALRRLQPDVMVVLGDRFEIFAAVQAAFTLRIPVAHLHGGETTAGALDEAYRHCITKMAHWHFVAAEPYRQRVIQLGEDPERVFLTGATAVDNILNLELPSREALAKELDFDLGAELFVITYHPPTLSEHTPESGVTALLAALDQFPDAQLLFTQANADHGGRAINQILERYVQNHPNRARLFASLGQRRYLAAVRHAAVVIGNSSSGLYEVPALKTPSVNIGLRQQGRFAPDSVIHCAEDPNAITHAIHQARDPAFRAQCQTGKLPFGDGHAVANILQILKNHPLPASMAKPFHDWT